MSRIQYNVKIDQKDLVLMRKITSGRGDNVSDFIRIAIRKELAQLGFLTKQEMKMLGVV